VVEDVGDGGAALAVGVAGREGVRVDRVLADFAGGVDAGGDEVAGADFEGGYVGGGRGGPPFSVAGVVDGFVDLAGEGLPLGDVGVGAAPPSAGGVIGWLVA